MSEVNIEFLEKYHCFYVFDPLNLKFVVVNIYFATLTKSRIIEIICNVHFIHTFKALIYNAQSVFLNKL